MRITRSLIGFALMLTMALTVIIFGTGCASVQDLTGAPKQKRSQVAMIRVVSESNTSATTTITSVDGKGVDSQKSFVSVLPGEHLISVSLHKEVDVISGKKTSIKLYLNNTELTEPDEPDTVISIDSREPQTVRAQLEAGKTYYIHTVDSLRRVRRIGATKYEQDMLDRLANERNVPSSFAWTIVGDWRVEVRELVK